VSRRHRSSVPPQRPACSRLGDPTRLRANPPGSPASASPWLALVTVLQLVAPGFAKGSTAVVPDGYPTVQAAVDSYPDTILLRAGVYPESVLVLPQFKRVVLIADPAASPRPILQGLKLWANHSHDGDIKVVGLRIAGPAVIWSHSVSAHYDFEACSFDAGLGHGGIWIDYDHAGAGTSLLRCRIRRGVQLTVGDVTMESDTVEAGGASFLGGYVSVRDTWFRGPAGLGISNMSPVYYQVVGNRFENCAEGIHLYDDYNSGFMLVQNNVVRNSQNWGIRIDNAEYVDILGNDVRDSGGGIGANIRGAPFRVIENTVIGARGTGISLSDDAGGGLGIEVRNNAVLRCGGTGIVVAGGADPTYSITGNTSAVNEGAGYAMVISPPYDVPGPFDVSNNAAYGNAGSGLSWTGPGLPALGCNDWFANTAGATSGVAAGATDLSVDPQFCDLAGDDVRPRSNSPLIGGPCGTIGAKGVGCDAAGEVNVSPPYSSRGFAVRVIGSNPTAGPVAIEYALPRPAAIELTIHDLMGREVARLATGVQTEGAHTARWMGDVRGGPAGTGVYFVRLAWPEGRQTRRILLRR